MWPSKSVLDLAADDAHAADLVRAGADQISDGHVIGQPCAVRGLFDEARLRSLDLDFVAVLVEQRNRFAAGGGFFLGRRLLRGHVHRDAAAVGRPRERIHHVALRRRHGHELFAFDDQLVFSLASATQTSARWMIDFLDPLQVRDGADDSVR